MRSRLSYANVMATIAVFIALGGTSYAAITITGKNVKNGSLTGVDIKNNSLAGADVRRETLKSDDVRNGSLLARDFKSGELPQGPKGDKGDKGDTGTVDTSNFYEKSQSDARYLAKAGKAADADKLDGRDATDFGSAAKTATAGFGLFSENSACETSISPSVTVDVGPSGLVAVYAEGALSRPGTGTAASVYLYEPTDLPGCERVLRSTSYASPGELRRTMPGSTVGTIDRGSWLILRATPGTRTYSLRYGAEGGGGGALPWVDNKVLSVVAL
jgi:hypothetical protein